jgi:hypothetical protein
VAVTRDQIAALAHATVAYAACAALLLVVAHVTSWRVTGAIAVMATAGGVWWWVARVPRVWGGW